MGRKGITGWLLLAAVIGTACALLWGMMQKRFATGTSYPALSTLRADPLGARAVFEALDRLPGVRTSRNFGKLKNLAGGPGKTLFLLNTSRFDLVSDHTLDGTDIAGFAVDGGRVVITLDPHASTPLLDSAERALLKIEEERKAKRAKEEANDSDEGETSGKEEASAKSDPTPAPSHGQATPGPNAAPAANPLAEKSAGNDAGKSDEKTQPEHDDEEDEDAHPEKHRPSVAEALRFSVEQRKFIRSAKGGAELTIPPLSPISALPVPEWNSDTAIVAWKEDDDATPPGEKEEAKTPRPELDPAWEPLAFRGDRVMIAQRRLGTGSVVVCTDSYFMTNEALWREPAPEFILWLTGGAPTLVFDERHLGLGMGDDPGIMNLARRYHMHGLFIGGIVLFLLFVWRNSSTLIPHDEAADLGLDRGGVVSGEGAASGLVSLLRRGTPRSALLTRCLEVWRATPAASARIPAARSDAARQALDAALNDPAQRKNIAGLYRRLAQILHSKPPSS